MTTYNGMSTDKLAELLDKIGVDALITMLKEAKAVEEKATQMGISYKDYTPLDARRATFRKLVGTNVADTFKDAFLGSMEDDAGASGTGLRPWASNAPSAAKTRGNKMRGPWWGHA